MDFINELKAKSEKAADVKTAVIEEIKAYFENYLEGNELEEHLRGIIKTTEIKERKVFLKIDFWEYHSGCCTTRFYCAGKVWHNPQHHDGWESHSYKGIELKDVNHEIGRHLSTMLEQKMKAMGFDLLNKDYKQSRFDYYDVHYYFGW